MFRRKKKQPQINKTCNLIKEINGIKCNDTLIDDLLKAIQTRKQGCNNTTEPSELSKSTYGNNIYHFLKGVQSVESHPSNYEFSRTPFKPSSAHTTSSHSAPQSHPAPQAFQSHQAPHSAPQAFQSPNPAPLSPPPTHITPTAPPADTENSAHSAAHTATHQAPIQTSPLPPPPMPGTITGTGTIGADNHSTKTSSSSGRPIRALNLQMGITDLKKTRLLNNQGSSISVQESPKNQQIPKASTIPQQPLSGMAAALSESRIFKNKADALKLQKKKEERLKKEQAKASGNPTEEQESSLGGGSRKVRRSSKSGSKTRKQKGQKRNKTRSGRKYKRNNSRKMK